MTDRTSGLPSGTLTFLFTDIAGSTRLWEQYPEAMKTALARHDALLRKVVEGHGGHVFKLVGDACHAVFGTARSALVAACASQRALRAEAWEVPGGLLVRMALHTGAAEERDGDYFGMTLNRVARILAAGHGGQILVSEATHVLIDNDLPTDVSLRDQGQHRLKDLARPEHIFQLVSPDFPSEFPALLTLDTLPNNLPRQLTSFVGREHEMVDVKSLLGKSFLLTLTGTGGSGKTRLAFQVAADVVDDYSDGVWLAEIAPLSDPSLVSPSVAAAVGVREELGGRPLRDKLLEFLRPKSVLLLLDNCEHLLAACADLAVSLLQACPSLRILATSQEPLHVDGEVTYHVPSLSLPDLKRLPSFDQLTQYEAIHLFVDRAALSSPGFRLTERNAPLVAQVCHRLDGIPLAIELAAARMKAMSVEQIAERLNERFRLLTLGTRNAPARHQTLRAALDWSYDLLSAREQTLLRRIAIFAGGFTLDAAEAMCTDEHVSKSTVLDLLTALVDRSLVVFDQAGEPPRYRLLETVRLYGLERLQASGEEVAMRTRHGAWYVHFTEQAESGLQGPDQRTWLDQLEVEHDNLRAALDWSRRDEADGAAGMRLAGALWRFWEVRGYWTEGREWLDGMLARNVSAPAPVRVKVLNGAAYLAYYQGDFKRLQALAEQILPLSREIGDKRETAVCLNVLGLQACRLENYTRAAALGDESLTLSRETGDKWSIAHAVLVQGLVARGQGSNDRAMSLLEEALTMFRALSDKWKIALTISNLGLVVREQGDDQRATACFEEALSQFRELGDKWGTAFSLSNLAIVAWGQQNYGRSAALFGESLALRNDLREKPGIATSLVGLAGVAAALGQSDRAAVLFGAAEALRETIGIPLPPFIRDDYQGRVASLKTRLGDAAFTAAWAKGRAMPLEEAIATGLTGEVTLAGSKRP